MAQELNHRRQHQIPEGCHRQHQEAKIALTSRMFVGDGAPRATLVPNAGLYTEKKIYAQLLSPTGINLRHCAAGHTVQDHVHMDRGADLVIARSTQPRLQQNQQQWPHLLLLKKSCLLKDKEPPSSNSSPSSTTSTIAISGTDWSPLDDNIEVSLPSSGEKCPSREDVDAHIPTVLYGFSGRKRLPAFVEFSE